MLVGLGDLTTLSLAVKRFRLRPQNTGYAPIENLFTCIVIGLSVVATSVVRYKWELVATSVVRYKWELLGQYLF